MVFTKKNTIRDIYSEMKKDEKCFNFFNMLFLEEWLGFAPDEAIDWSLEEVEQKVMMPWKKPFPADDMIKAAYLAKEQCERPIYDVISLWNKNSGGNIPSLHPSTKNSVCIFTKKPDEVRNKPAVIICPGGGYENLSVYSEGLELAGVLEQAGYHAFVLTYRLKPNSYPLPQVDLCYAMKYVRANADFYGIDADNVMILGSSAGGHLCASYGFVYKEIEKELMDRLKDYDANLAQCYEQINVKPNKIALSYPVINLLEDFHEGSAVALTGGDKALCEKLSVDRHISADYPKTFVWACEDDDVVPVSNSRRLGAALASKGVEHKIEIFPTGGHGCGLAYDTSASSWMADLIEFMR